MKYRQRRGMAGGAATLLLAALILAAVAPAQAREGQKVRRIVVWRLEPKTGVTAEDVDSLSGALAAEVEQRSGAQVMTEADVQTVIKGEEQRMRCGDTEAGDSQCMVEIGNALGADEAVSGNLGKVGEVWILNISRIDLRTVKVIKRVSKRAKGDITAVVDALSEVVADLFDVALPAATPAASVTPSAPATPHAPPPTATATTSAGAASPDPDVPASWKAARWGSLCAGLGLLAISGVGFGLGSYYGDDYNQTGASSSRSTSRAMVGAAWAGLASGAALLITSTVLFLVDPPSAPTSPTASTPTTPALAVGAGPAGPRGGLLLTVQGGW